MTTVVTGKLQLTVPADMAKRMGIETGTRIDWSAADSSKDTIVLKIQPSRRQMFARLLAISRRYSAGAEDSAAFLERLRGDAEKEMMEDVAGSPVEGRQ